MHKVVAHPPWSGWKTNRYGNILPQKRGGQLHWPTMVLNGDLVNRLKDPFALSPLVVKGFQSCGAITVVNLEMDKVRDYRVETLGGREFILTLPDRENAAFVQDTCRGLANIAASNRANFLLSLQDVRHTMKNEINFIILCLSIFKMKKDISKFKAGLKELKQPSASNLMITPIDDLVNDALNGLWQIKNACQAMVDQLIELDVARFVNREIKVTADDFNGVRASAIDEVQKLLPRKINCIQQEFNDLGRFNLIESTTLQGIDSLRLAAMDYPVKADGLRDVKILGNETILMEVFSEIIRNARRAAGLQKAKESDLIEIKLQRVNDDKMLEVKVTNKVISPKAKRYLRKNADYLFEEHNDQDGHGKQRIFKMGISSRKKGGMGLALLWEYVVLKLKGEIHADYDPQGNEFSIAVSFRISK